MNFTELSTPSIMDQVIGHSSAKVPYRKVKTFDTKQEAQAWADSVRGDESIKVTSIEQEIPMLHTSSYSEDPFLQLQRVSKRNCERLRLKGAI